LLASVGSVASADSAPMRGFRHNRTECFIAAARVAPNKNYDTCAFVVFSHRVCAANGTWGRGRRYSLLFSENLFESLHQFGAPRARKFVEILLPKFDGGQLRSGRDSKQCPIRLSALKG
jgi:hypothetical protein